jgi:hypothetical protein
MKKINLMALLLSFGLMPFPATTSFADAEIIGNSLCAMQAPNLTISGPRYYIKGGDQMDLLINIVNQDSVECPGRSFSLVTCFGDQLGTWDLSPSAIGQVTWTITAPAKDGVYYRNVSAYSSLGVLPDKASMSFVVDSTPPAGPAPSIIRFGIGNIMISRGRQEQIPGQVLNIINFTAMGCS